MFQTSFNQTDIFCTHSSHIKGKQWFALILFIERKREYHRYHKSSIYLHLIDRCITWMISFCIVYCLIEFLFHKYLSLLFPPKGNCKAKTYKDILYNCVLGEQPNVTMMLRCPHTSGQSVLSYTYMSYVEQTLSSFFAHLLEFIHNLRCFPRLPLGSYWMWWTSRVENPIISAMLCL